MCAPSAFEWSERQLSPFNKSLKNFGNRFERTSIAGSISPPATSCFGARDSHLVYVLHVTE
jgi:hypothetical protein